MELNPTVQPSIFSSHPPASPPPSPVTNTSTPSPPQTQPSPTTTPTTSVSCWGSLISGPSPLSCSTTPGADDSNRSGDLRKMAVTFRTTAVEGAQMMEYQQPDVLGIGESAKERSGREQVKMGEDVEVEDIYDINVLLGEHNMWNADLRKLNKTFITSPVPSTPPPSPLTATNTDSDTTFLTAHGLPLLATTPTLTTLTASLLTLHHRLAVAEFIIDDPGVHAAAAASLSILESDGNGDGELRVKGEGEGEDDDVELELGRVMREVDAMKKKVDIAERVLGMDDDWVNAWVWVTAGGGMV
ncbi:hypothetical protein EX30DRAFT_349917 [Ascodesmis nigricans]|uniref:Uncharacterized protein n=1 Tax=Ascodesmis nigricans TaxID=341454 RepID=A0A4S2MTY6_9PEZI|nr:hypothetical protein EX30DRAFT_349917 [Ascodesmis nigricans]